MSQTVHTDNTRVLVISKNYKSTAVSVHDSIINLINIINK